MSKAGLHVTIGNRKNWTADLLAPCAVAGSPVSVVFSVDENLWPDLQKHSPQTVLIFRTQKDAQGREIGDGPGDIYQGNPVTVARDWMAAIMPVWAKNKAHYYAPLNEQDPAELWQFVWLNDFTVECMAIAEANGYKLALYAFSAGNPKNLLKPGTDEIAATKEQCWAELLPSLKRAKAQGHILLLHEYGFDSAATTEAPKATLRASAPHLALRHRQIYTNILRPENADCRLVISEASAGVGYKPARASLTKAQYMDDIAWYDARLMEAYWNDIVIGFCVYQLGGAENCLEILPNLAQHIVAHPPIVTPPPPPPGAESIVETVHLLPQDATLEELMHVHRQHFADKPTVTQSATSAKLAVKRGLPGSKVIVWRKSGWQGDIVAWLGVPVELREFPWAGASVNVPYLSQLSETAQYAKGDCGAACVGMVLNTKGRGVTVDDVSKATGKPRGFPNLNNLEMIAVARKLGLELSWRSNFNAQMLEAELKKGNPVIALINYAVLPERVKGDPEYTRGHYVVITGVSANAITYHDPYWPGSAGANIRLSLAEFDRAWATPNADINYPRQVLTVYSYTPPAPGAAWIGVHMRADGLDHNDRHFAAELQVLRTARANAAKIMTLGTFESLDAVLATGIHADRVVLRLHASGDNTSLKDPQRFYNDQRGWLAYFASRSGRIVEVHNEPNLELEGLGFAWRNGAEFAAWYDRVVSLIRANHPSLKICFPGLSPQPNVNEWLSVCAASIARADYVGAHAYWTDASQMQHEEHGGYWKRYVPFGKQIIITEFANLDHNTPQATKGAEYVMYWRTLPAQVVGAFAWVSSASAPMFATEVWRTEAGALTDIPRVVGARA